MTAAADLARVSVVVVAWNTRDLLLACLASLEPARRAGAEVLVVDNASCDGSAAAVRDAFPGVRLTPCLTNTGYAAGNNLGAAQSMREYVMLLNSDTEVRAGALEALVRYLDRSPQHAAAAPRLVFADGSAQRACMGFPGVWTPLFFGTPLQRWLPRNWELRRYLQPAFDPEREADVDQPPAAALLVRRSDWLRLGGFDERLWLFFNDVDFCKRLAKSGRKVRYVPRAGVLHHVGQSTRRFPRFVEQWHADRLAYHRKHHGVLAGPWVKLCTGLIWFDQLAQQAVRRLRGRPCEPLGPLCRAFGQFLRS
jgi:hypothetical protein